MRFLINKSTFEFKNKIYVAIELANFDTADGYHIDFGVFVSEDFIDADDDSFLYRLIDNKVYAYLPRELIETGSESEIKKYIKKNIG